MGLLVETHVGSNVLKVPKLQKYLWFAVVSLLDVVALLVYHSVGSFATVKEYFPGTIEDFLVKMNSA